MIIDGVFNHTGRDFFAFADLRKRQAKSPYRDWYIVQSFDDPATPQNEFRYKGWWGTDTLPEFANNAAGNDLHPGPKQVHFGYAPGVGWIPTATAIRRTASTAGGWTWRTRCRPASGAIGHALARQINPQCYTVAEIWDDAQRFLDEGRFSATMNYHGFAFPVKGFLIDEPLAAERCRAAAQ